MRSLCLSESGSGLTFGRKGLKIVHVALLNVGGLGGREEEEEDEAMSMIVVIMAMKTT